jgi:hypothetical protein
MGQKIFISYRRQDSAANAVGIAQYLENEFGRKNVYIDAHVCLADIAPGTSLCNRLEPFSGADLSSIMLCLP